MDADLVIQARQGDLRAFETLAERHYGRLQRAAVGILRDVHAAEDATQEALVSVWRDLRTLRDPERFEGWSYRVLVRACHAQAKRIPRTVSEADLPLVHEATAADAYGRVLYRDELERGFRRLPIDQRAVVVLHHLVDLPLEQVAEALDIPVGTVKSRLSRAMEGLRGAIEADARSPISAPTPREVAR
jgi:RNA polymerase sigma-70 factor (ECF subfamily)